MNNNSYPRNYMPNHPYNVAQQNLYEQNMYEQIDNQINQLQGMKNQIKNNNAQQPTQQPTAINQTFQLSPNSNGIRYANSIDDVNKETVFFDTPYFSKDLSVLWIKNASGDIKAYELNEIIQKDEKDMQIELLQAQVNELKGMIENERNNTNVDEPKVTEDTTTVDKPVRKSTKTSKSTSVSRVSKSKTE